MPNVFIAIWRKTCTVDETIISIKETDCATLFNPLGRFCTWLLVNCSDLFQHSHLGTGLGFGLEYFPSKSLVCDTDLDQLWNPGSVVFNSAFPTFPSHNSFGAFGRVDGNQWRNVGHGNDCLLSASCYGCTAYPGYERCGDVSYTLSTTVYVTRVWDEHPRYYCYAHCSLP